MAGIVVDEEVEVKRVDIVVSKGDDKGDITYANPVFFKLSGYEPAELMYKPHSILRHPDMPKIIFKYFWDSIKAGKDVVAFIKNLRKDGKYYWIIANIKVAKNPDGSFRNYVSTRKTMSANARKIIEPIYAKLLKAEQEGGIEASAQLLEKFLTTNNSSLENFNDLMQKIQG